MRNPNLLILGLFAALAGCGAEEAPGVTRGLASAPNGTTIVRGSVKFTPDGRHVTFVATEAGKARVYVNAEAGPPYDAIQAPYFLGAGPAVAYAARAGSRWHAVIGDEKSPEFDAISGPFVGPSGTPAFIGTRGGTQHVLADGNVSEGFEAVDKLEFRMGANGLGPVAAVRKEDEHVYTRAGLGPAFVDIESLVLSPDGGRYAYVGVTDEGQQLHVDGKQKASGDVVSLPGFSQDGKSAFAIVERDRKALLWQDDTTKPTGLTTVYLAAVAAGGKALLAGPAADGQTALWWNGKLLKLGRDVSVRAVLLTPDGAHAAWMLDDEVGKKTSVFVDGKQIGTYEGTVYLGQLSEDGQVAFAVRTLTGEHAYLNDKQVLRAKIEMLAFGPTGRLAAVGKRHDGHVVVYGRAARIRPPVFGSLRFDDDGTLRLGLQDGNQLHAFEMKAP